MAQAKRTKGDRGCIGSAGADAAAAVSLPVLGETAKSGNTIRKSKNGPRRAIVLAVVQLLIIAHIVQWLVTGTTTTPIEPSEAMEFTKYGVINAGVIFLALVMLSTLILGRWFCGWGCHVVLLQDLCGWMMKKVGIRPKPFRSRLLMWVPLLLGIYMFIWPAIYRLAIAPLVGTSDRMRSWELTAQLTTDDFWQTFPGLAVAIPFLLICGFATVYFLGAKGFCTYGCPYGGLFAAVDEYAPGRIRVTDACEQCGHCTAVCTSNVRVHEEVREYGMVVDPGCMKCLDCVSVCPNDALYFGFGKPASAKGPPKNQAPRRRFDLSWREEVAFAAVFAGVFFAFRGDYMTFPLLMAAGIAIVMTYIIWKAYRLLGDDNSALHRFQLKLRGKLQPAGWAITAGAALIAMFVVHTALVSGMTVIANRHDARVQAAPMEVYFGDESLDELTSHHARRGAKWYARAFALAGGAASPARQWRDGVSLRRSWLHAVAGDFASAEQAVHHVVQRAGDMESVHARSLGLALAAQGGRDVEVVELYRQMLAVQSPTASRVVLNELMMWVQHGGDGAAVIDICRQRLEQYPSETHTMRWLGLLLLDSGQTAEGIALLQRVLELDPEDAAARSLLDMATDALQSAR